jgi:protein O-GlcNAc transferase
LPPQLYKLDPEIFRCWCRVLQRAPGAVLWLLRFPPAGEANVRLAARAFGLR